MSQFRPVQSAQQPGVASQPTLEYDWSAPQAPAGFAAPPVPYISLPATTPPFTLMADQQIAMTTDRLSALAGSQALSSSTSGRIIRIPGAPKQTPITEQLPVAAHALNTRLRHAIVLTAIMLISMTTLLSLAPLSNGQSIASPFFTGVFNWVEAQQADWKFQTHMQEVATQAAQNNNAMTITNPAPAPMILPQSAYVAIAQQDASAAGISPLYFVRQINQESGFNTHAVSPGGAEGIAQFEPATAASLGIDPFNPSQALNAAAHVMAGYSKMYGGNYAMALAAYNAGTGSVQNAINSCGSANWMNCLPAETQNYIRIIMGM
jgi:Transglycosylase SLT domain